MPTRRGSSASPPGSIGNCALLQAEEALLKAEIADLEAKSAAKQPGKSKTTPPDTATPLKQAREAVAAAQKSVNDDAPNYPPLTPVYPATSTGRRLRLARWITHPENPLTARVAINQIWMRHFDDAAGPVRVRLRPQRQAPHDPGVARLAGRRLQSEGWKMKPIHRLIVTSASYRMESSAVGPDDPNLALDPANMLLLEDEPQAHGSRGRARQSSCTWRATST